MVESPADYAWSSYQANALGKSIAMHTTHPVYLRLGELAAVQEHAYRALFEAHVDVDAGALIREATNKRLTVGSDRFKAEIERLSGLRVTERKRGLKPKNEEFLF